MSSDLVNYNNMENKPGECLENQTSIRLSMPATAASKALTRASRGNGDSPAGIGFLKSLSLPVIRKSRETLQIDAINESVAIFGSVKPLSYLEYAFCEIPNFLANSVWLKCKSFLRDSNLSPNISD